MVRSLARVYFYVVFDAMLVLAAVGLGILVSLLLQVTALRGPDPLPDAAQATRTIVLTIVLWVIAGALGGLHYWLIRRDIAQDPAAAGSAARSFFLNAGEFVAVAVGVSVGAAALSRLGEPFPTAEYSIYATALAAFFVAGVLELERRRTEAGPGTPIIFQRLHLYGMQLILTLEALGFLLSAIGATVQATLYAAKLYTPCPGENFPPEPPPGVSIFCPAPNALGPWFAAIFVVLVFAAYRHLARGDERSTLRQVEELLALTVGAFVTLLGVYMLLDFVVRRLLGDTVGWQSLASDHDFLPPLVTGLLIAGAYTLWLRREAPHSRMGAVATELSIVAIAAAVLAGFFWVGAGRLLYDVIVLLTNPDVHSQPFEWATPLALALTGVAYIPVSLALRQQTRATSVTGPRRAFVLALLAAGTITGAVGAALLLYSVGSAALGAAPDDWQDMARSGSALLLVGAALASLYGWSAVSEGLLGGAVKGVPSAPIPATPSEGDTVEAILDELLAGNLTRAQAADRVRGAVRAEG